MTHELITPVKHKPTMPLTTLQKRWLKTLLLDKRIRLFIDDKTIAEQETALMDIEPLYRPEQLVFFDRSNDGDDYSNPVYRNNFRILLESIENKRKIKLFYRNIDSHSSECLVLLPVLLEYSAKEDSFQLKAIYEKQKHSIALSSVISVEAGTIVKESAETIEGDSRQRLVMEIEDYRNAMVRALMHFSDLAKETEKLDDLHYKLIVYYDKEDEREMVNRVLCFGPMLKVIEPQSFVELIKNRLRMQMQR